MPPNQLFFKELVDKNVCDSFPKFEEKYMMATLSFCAYFVHFASV